MSELPLDFSVDADTLKLWLNEYKGKKYLHMIQNDSKRKSYVCIEACEIDQLYVCCLQTARPDFERCPVKTHKADGGTQYVLELVKTCENEYSLQIRGVKYDSPLKKVTITDMETFKQVLCKASKSLNQIANKVQKKAEGNPFFFDKVNDVGIGISEFKSKYYAHFTQKTEFGERRYVYTDAGNLKKLQNACRLAGDKDMAKIVDPFVRKVIDTYQTKDEAHVLELINDYERDDIYLLQKRSTKLCKPNELKLSDIKGSDKMSIIVTDVNSLNDTVGKAYKAYTRMFFDNVSSPCKRSKPNSDDVDDDATPKKLRIDEKSPRDMQTAFSRRMNLETCPLTGYEDELTRSGFPDDYAPISPIKI